MTRLFLAVVGAAYVMLAAWCVVLPQQTSTSVGFTLNPGSGQSEYLVVYGGLQLGLGLIFLWPMLDPNVARFSLTSCLVVHGSLVVFRTLSFMLYPGIGTTTYALAGIEWVISLGSIWRLITRDSPSAMR